MPLNLHGPALEALQGKLANEGSSPPSISSPARPKGIGISPYIALLAGQGADLASTAHKLGQGYHEKNGIMAGQGLGKMAAYKLGGVGVTAAFMALMDHLSKDPENEHQTFTRNAGKLAGFGAGAVGSLAASHNELGTPFPLPVKK